MGAIPILLVNSYLYYVLFVDDHSRFTWFYPLKAKSKLFGVVDKFMKFFQTQFATKIKTFQSDGGTKFFNNNVKTLLSDNGTFHQISCMYTPQQNGCIEWKHRHIVETGLAMLFHAMYPPHIGFILLHMLSTLLIDCL